jgi:glycosyltransferase involved in cell wall biosynthesis
MNVILFANTDWYLYNFRLSLARELQRQGHHVILICPQGPYVMRLEQLGFACIPAPMLRQSLNPIRELSLIYWLFKRLRQEHADLVHGFTIKCAVYGALAGRLAGIARVSAIAGMGFVFTSPRVKARVLRPLVKSVIKFALGGGRARIILQNTDDLQTFKLAGFGPISKLIQGSGVDCERFVPREAGAARQRFRVVVASRLLWDKGLGDLIEAARILRQEGRCCEIFLAGDPDSGNPASIPLEALTRWDAEGLITRLGHVTDMPGLYQGADVVVLPSYREGLPKSLIEAAACGRALITTDVPGCREVVHHEVDGLLVPARDPVALARAIARLQDDPVLTTTLGAAARRKALEKFDEKLVIRETMQIYDELCGLSRAPPSGGWPPRAHNSRKAD